MEIKTSENETKYLIEVATKTRQQMADEYGMSYKVFMRRLKFYGIILPPGIITPKYQIRIYEAFGSPPSNNGIV